MSGTEPKVNDVNTVVGKAFSRMTGAEKSRFVGKVIVFLITFGFVFPNVLVE